MLYTLKRWISGTPTDAEWGGLAAWAKQKNWDLKRLREDGFVIEGALEEINGQPSWRMEWGQSQRSYFSGPEIRARVELQMPDDLQMMVLDRPLMQRLEKAAYEQFTDTTQTFVDSSTPEEMRWLSMYPKVLTTDKSLREQLAVVASEPSVAASWLEGPLSGELSLAANDWIRGESAFVLMTLRGRLHLRMGCAEPVPALVEKILRLFFASALHADRVAKASGAASANEWPSTAISAWQAQLDATDGRPDGETR